MVTPYDFVHVFSGLIQKYGKEKIRQKKLLTLIDFAISLPSFMLYSQDDIFFGCFMIVFEKLLDENDRRLMDNVVGNWKHITGIKNMIQCAFMEMLGCSI